MPSDTNLASTRSLSAEPILPHHHTQPSPVKNLQLSEKLLPPFPGQNQPDIRLYSTPDASVYNTFMISLKLVESLAEIFPVLGIKSVVGVLNVTIERFDVRIKYVPISRSLTSFPENEPEYPRSEGASGFF